MNITEDYVSFETAKLLKEKGFDSEEVGYRDGFYSETAYESGHGIMTESGKEVGLVYDDLLNSELGHNEYLRPTLQMAMKWMRKVHNVDIEIHAHAGMLGIKVYMPYVSVYTPYKLNDIDIECGLTEDDVKGRVRQKKMSTRIPDKTELIPAHACFNTYEEAVEAALKYCLTNLI